VYAVGMLKNKMVSHVGC